MKLGIIDRKGPALHPVTDYQELFGNQIDRFEVAFPTDFNGDLFRRLPRDVTHIITAHPDRLHRDLIGEFAQLEYIGLSFTGFWDALFDIDALKERRITVVPNSVYPRGSVIEAVMAALLTHYRHLDTLQLGDPGFVAPLGRELGGRTLGVIGMGNLGATLAQVASGIGMHVIHASTRYTGPHRKVDREELLQSSDVISLHVPKSAGVVITADDLADMRPDATIVNTSGTEMIETEALVSWLRQNPSAGYLFMALPSIAYFEAFQDLPNARMYPVFTMATEEAEERRRSVTAENLRSYMAVR